MTGARPDGALIAPADVVAVGGGALVDPECLWCAKHFRPRQDGGKRQRFCAEPCRRLFAKAALAWVVQAVASGRLAREQLWNASPATRRSPTEAKGATGVVEYP